MNIRTTLVLIIALTVIGGIAYFQSPLSDREDPNPWFYSTEMDDVIEVEIIAQGEKESFIKYQGAWVFQGEELIPIDYDRWGGMTLLLSGPTTSRVLADEVPSLSRYGLNNPARVFSVGLRGDRQIILKLGDITPDGYHYYAMQGDDPHLYLIDDLWVNVLSKLATDPPYPQWLYKFYPDQVVFLNVKAGGNKSEFIKDDAGWRFSGKDRSQIDSERWHEIEPILGGPSHIRIIKGQLEPEDFQKYGLDVPKGSIRVEYRPEESIESLKRSFEMEIGSKTEDGTSRYVKVVGQPYLLEIDQDWYGKIELLAIDPPYASPTTDI
tara:strand:+ start:10402 stop:11370 length:969 start_codon:yes stop_codon:yes gene_type:complete